MYCHYPKELPDLEVYYNLMPGQAQTFEDPGFEPEIEWEDIEIAGQSISLELHHHFISTFGTKWERDIITGLKSRRRAA